MSNHRFNATELFLMVPHSSVNFNAWTVEIGKKLYIIYIYHFICTSADRVLSSRTSRSGVERTNHEATAPPVPGIALYHVWFTKQQWQLYITDQPKLTVYVGLTENSFKTRFANHKSSFNNPNKRLSRELRRHVWCLKEARLKLKIIWKVLQQTSPYNPVLNQCNLCHFSLRHTKLRTSQDICWVCTTNIECTMTIFRHCDNVLNNK